jgi:hypothetical protein
LNGSAAKFVPAQESQVSPKVVAQKFLPGRRLPTLILVPFVELVQRLAVIALGVVRGAAISSEMLKEFPDAFVLHHPFRAFGRIHAPSKIAFASAGSPLHFRRSQVHFRAAETRK